MQSSTRPGCSAEEYSHWRNCDQCTSRQVVVLCIKEGSAACAKFIDNRLKKSLSINSTISKIKFTSAKTTLKLDSKADVKGETIKTLMFIEYGCHRGFTVEELLQHEITNSAFFLVDKDGYLMKSVKSQLGTELSTGR